MALGLSQTELAALVDIPIPNLSRIEHGRQSIYIERLVELADALKVSTDYLLNRTDDPTPPKHQRRRRAPAGEEEGPAVGAGVSLGDGWYGDLEAEPDAAAPAVTGDRQRRRRGRDRIS